MCSLRKINLLYTVCMKLLLLFLLGLGILSGAILLNVIASTFGLLSWFEFLKDPKAADSFSYVWLFILYPFGLGTIAFYLKKFLNL